MNKQRVRVLLAKIGIDVHDVGIKNLALNLRESGMEVIYTGLRTPIDAIPKIAVEEDVNVIGVSFLQGAHLALAPLLIQKLKEYGANDIPVIVGGIIPHKDVHKLKGEGVADIFLPGSRFDEIVAFIQTLVTKTTTKSSYG